MSPSCFADIPVAILNPLLTRNGKFAGKAAEKGTFDSAAGYRASDVVFGPQGNTCSFFFPLFGRLLFQSSEVHIARAHCCGYYVSVYAVVIPVPYCRLR